MRAGAFVTKAHAKVNLGLAVLTRRGDGFHEVETLMVRVELHDDVKLTVTQAATLERQSPVFTVTLSGRAEDVPGSHELAWGESNLAQKAARAYLAAYEARATELGLEVEARTVTIELIKRVPVAAGLGGGSADAAAVLAALRQSDKEAQPTGEALVGGDELLRLALDLGSDVPFFLGPPAAVARGRGERLVPAEVPPLPLVLVNPGVVVSAADAYSNLVGFTPRLREARALGRLKEGLDPGWSNGLQPGVLRLHPELRGVLAALRSAGLKGVIMSGSGSTCFGVAESGTEAEAVANELARSNPDWWVRAMTTVA